MNRKHFGCKVEGCNGKHHAKGYCERHYWQMRSYGCTINNPSRSKKDSNEIIVIGDEAKIIIYDNLGNLKAECFIDASDVDLCKNHKWSMKSQRYLSSKINGKTRTIHRYILNITDCTVNVDHIDRDVCNNRKSNLRTCKKSANVLNVGVRTDNTSGYKGVSFNTEQQKWIARIQVDSKRHMLGYFISKELAALAYNLAAVEYHGEFAYINDIGDIKT